MYLEPPSGAKWGEPTQRTGGEGAEPDLIEEGSGLANLKELGKEEKYHQLLSELRSRVALMDGGGLETAWKRYTTILISDGGKSLQPDTNPPSDWAVQARRVLDLIDNQVQQSLLAYMCRILFLCAGCQFKEAASTGLLQRRKARWRILEYPREYDGAKPKQRDSKVKPPGFGRG